MEYVTGGSLNIDEEYILRDKVLPTAKRWVMSFPPGSSLHENGLRILKHWQVKDAELRAHMASLAR